MDCLTPSGLLEQASSSAPLHLLLILPGIGLPQGLHILGPRSTEPSAGQAINSIPGYSWPSPALCSSVALLCVTLFVSLDAYYLYSVLEFKLHEVRDFVLFPVAF